MNSVWQNLFKQKMDLHLIVDPSSNQCQFFGQSSESIQIGKLVEKDIIHAYSLVLPLDKIIRIPDALMAPMNIMKQNTIEENGRTMIKKID